MKLKYLPLISAVVAMFVFFLTPILLIIVAFFYGSRIYLLGVIILIPIWLALTALVGVVFHGITAWILEKSELLKEPDGQNDEQPDKTKKPVL